MSPQDATPSSGLSDEVRRVAEGLTKAQRKLVSHREFRRRAFHPPLLFLADELVALGLMSRPIGRDCIAVSREPTSFGALVRAHLLAEQSQ